MSAGVGNPSFNQKMGYGKMGFSKDGKEGNDGKDGFSRDGKDGFKISNGPKMGKMGFTP